MISADPTKETMENDLPAMIKQGHGSIKIFMTYDLLKIDDEPLLDILLAAREGGAMLCAVGVRRVTGLWDQWVADLRSWVGGFTVAV